MKLLLSIALTILFAGCATRSTDKFANCQFDQNGFQCPSGISCRQSGESSMLCTGGLRCDLRDESLYCSDGSIYGKNGPRTPTTTARNNESLYGNDKWLSEVLGGSNIPYTRSLITNASDFSCILGSGGLLQCSNGVYCQASSGSGLVRCSNGISCQLDSSGLMRCNQGTSASRDASGLTRFSNGNWSISDKGGLTRNRDGSYCITDKEFNLTRCFPGSR